MKNSKSSLSIFTKIALVLVCICFVLSGCKAGVDEEYKYNTEIETNANSPVEGDIDITAITGYVEDNEQKFLTLPYSVEDTDLVITSVGKYTGTYPELGTDEQVEDILALVVENTSDKIVSYSSFTVEYDDEKMCTFNPTNIPAHQSVLVFSNGEAVAYSDVKKLECTDSMAVMTTELPILEGVVGVDFVDGQFVVTNLTSDDLGDVYIRYKTCTQGNTYLGGITYSVMVPNVEGYETYKVDADNFDEETGVIIAVENIKE